MGRISNYLFNQIHQNSLIYNTCWEDPKCDRRLLNLGKKSKILMITSAGCNALEYLLDDVEAVHCVDLNYRQNAVLALKIALIKHGDFHLLFKFFGDGSLADASTHYKRDLRPLLEEEYRHFWDRKIKYFRNWGIRKTFYYRGSSGVLAFAVTRYLKLKPKLDEKIKKLLRSLSFEEQLRIYNEIRTGLFSPIINRLLHSQMVLNLAGVPRSQTELFVQEYEDNDGGYIGASLDRVFHHMPIKDNYFYSVYYRGSYEKDRCPEYLKEENFEVLRNRIDRIHINTNSLEEYCNQTTERFSHFILLDHMDWLAKNNIEGLIAEWRAFFSHATIGAKVLFRSASKNLDWLPDSVKLRIDFEDRISEKCEKMDRVGTYDSTWLGRVKN